jgi:hypothetical protein
VRDRFSTLVVYLECSGPVVGLPVGGIVVLIGIEVFIRVIRHKLFHIELCAVRPFERVGVCDVRTVSEQDPFPFGAGVGRDGEFYAVSEGSAYQRVRDPGIPARSVNNGLSHREGTAPLPFPYHAESRPVLDRTAGIVPFRLGEYLNPGGNPWKPREPQKWGIPYPLNEGWGTDGGICQ